MKILTLKDAIKEKSRDPEFKEAYDRELMINEIATLVVKLRKKAKLTQQELADRVGTKQSVIARLESGKNKRAPTIALLGRIAKASNAKLEVKFVQSKH